MPASSLQTILVVTDLSPREHGAMQRASQLARLHGAHLAIACLPAHSGDVPSAAALARAARRLEDELGQPVEISAVPAGRPECLVEAASGVDLVVLPHRRERSTAAFFRGQPVARLLRRIGCPVLVTRAGGGPYRQVLVAVDFSPGSESLVRWATRIGLDADLEIFHAISTAGEARLRSAEATGQAVRAYRERKLQQANERLLEFTDSFDARRNRFFTTLGRGDPGRQVVVQQERSGADLVVVGKRPVSAWADFFCGSVAHRVLSWGTRDVLVVPHLQGPSREAVVAPRRMLRASRRAVS